MIELAAIVIILALGWPALRALGWLISRFAGFVILASIGAACFVVYVIINTPGML